MRVKHKPWAKDRLEEFPAIYIKNPEDFKGQWREVFGMIIQSISKLVPVKVNLLVAWQKQIRKLTILVSK